MVIKRGISYFQSELRKQIATLIVGALSFVAALSWNTAIQSIINTFIPASDEVFYSITAAIGVTLIAVAGIAVISHLNKKE